MKLIASIALLLTASVSVAQGVPNTFTAGTPARAADVNANFANVDGRVNTNASDIASIDAVLGQLFASIEFQAIIQTTEGVAAALCPANTLPISASCYCDGDGSTRNFGVLFACANAVDGAVAGCFVDSTYNPSLPGPLATVATVCISATLVNGNPAFTNPWAVASGKGVIGDFSKASRDTTVDMAAADLQNAVTNRLSAIKTASE